MKKIFTLIFLLSFTFLSIKAQQRIVAECTINYSVELDTSVGNTNSFWASASKVVYIKGNDCRTDLISPTFSQTVLYDKGSGNAVVLREIGNNKLITKLSKKQWLEKNKKFDSSAITFYSDTKTLLGYECKKAIISYKDGSQTSVYYTPTIIPSVKEYEFSFKDVPGLVLEYETFEGINKVKYIANKIDLSPVTSSKFDVPTSGYRILN